MGVPTTNTSLSSIQTNFGGSDPISLSEYYSGGPLVPATNTDAPNGPIPSSGQIAIGQFRGAAKLITFNYMVIAGGGSGGGNRAGGGGAGGYRSSGFGPAPLQGTNLSLSPGAYSVVVGAGGVYGPPSPGATNSKGTPGSNSSFNAPSPTGITSSGGGGGGGVGLPADAGGSGGGQNHTVSGAGAAGNTPPVSPPQGQPGGPRTSPTDAGAGGGATGPGSGTPSGGAGVTNTITGSSIIYATGGTRGTGAVAPAGANSPANSGDGGNGGNNGDPGPAPADYYRGRNGGSGIVVLKTPASHPVSVSPATNTVTPSPTGTVVKFTVSGTLTVN